MMFVAIQINIAKFYQVGAPLNLKTANILAHGESYLIYENVIGSGCCINIVIDRKSGSEFIFNLREIEKELSDINNIIRNVELGCLYKKRIVSAIVSAMMGYVEEAKINIRCVEEDIVFKY